jgi:hypothetical protein
VSDTDADTPASAPEETADGDDSEAPRSVAADENNDENDLDEPATSEPGSPDPVTDPASDKPAKANSGKWMRGLSNALSRAATKTLGGQSTEAAPKQPKADDDPFPDGEPNEEKPKE